MYVEGTRKEHEHHQSESGFQIQVPFLDNDSLLTTLLPICFSSDEGHCPKAEEDLND